jgi:ribosomal silencing factor RsfS
MLASCLLICLVALFAPASYIELRGLGVVLVQQNLDVTLIFPVHDTMSAYRLCATCSNSLLTSFAATCGTRIRLPLQAKKPRLAASSLPARAFHQTRVSRNAPDKDKETETKAANDSSKSTEPDLVPWFLRVDTPKISRHPLAREQELPELPEDPPRELSDIVNQLFEEHGINDLVVLDLRPLDPPPAIGANTIMILGTARSVRHLHATADKICRYMRSTYRWSPHADGLQGRNELRLINRRKQRRGKVISTQMGEVDEAGNSGWVCVHGGKHGLVVQLFTQAKREEMDIEGLWRGILDRDQRHKRAEAERWAQRQRLAVAQGQTETLKEGSSFEIDDAQPTTTAYKSLPSISGPMVQTRSLHRLAVRKAPEVSGIDPSAFLEFSQIEDLRGYLSAVIPSKAEWKDSDVLQAHIDALRSPLVSPSALLGTGFGDNSSTLFLVSFHKALASASPAMQVKYELELHTLGNIYKPESYPVSSFLRFLQNLRKQGKALQVEHYYIILFHLATCPELRAVESKWQDAADRRLKIMGSYIEDLKIQLSAENAAEIDGRPEFRYAVFSALLLDPVCGIRQAIINHDGQPGTPLNLGLTKKFGEYPLHPLAFRAQGYDSLAATDLFAYTLREHHLDFITALALAGKWDRLWKFWKRLVLHRVSRSAEYYKLVFGLVALARNQKQAIYCARWLGLEFMSREVPRVSLKDASLANAFLRVIDIADGTDNGTEWARTRKIVEQTQGTQV